ncbi:MAG: thioredoxin family protein [Acidobacteria bacterium]|nr:thioredoxin family protein [Acidobacteriota bacterium]
MLTAAVSMALASLAVAQAPVSVSASVSPTSIAPGGKGTAKLTANIAAPWYMYSISQGAGGPIPTKISFGEGVFAMNGVSGPKPKVKFDENFKMNTESYSGSATFTIPFTVAADATEGEQTLTVNIRYQACNDSVCLPPKTLKATALVLIGAGKTSPSPSPSESPTPTPTPTPTPANVNVNTAANLNSNTANAASNAAALVESNTNSEAPRSQVSQPNRTAGGDLENGGFWGFIWLAMTFGALSLLTPCVFPMIPITVSYFTKNAAESHLGSIRDALIYAAGIILTFTALGIALALLFGAAGINQFAANPWINMLIMGIFLAFAFSLLGAYNIGIPPSILNRLDKLTRSKEGSRTLGLLLMGLTFSLTSFTCTAPLVGTILVAAANGKLFYPVVGMLAFSSVFALPFFILAVAPRLLHSLPSSGGWMNALKVVMGFLEIGAALKFLSNADLVWGWGIFTREVVIAGWIGLSVLIVFYLLGIFKLVHDYGEVKVGLIRVLNAFLFATLAFYLLTGLFGAKLGEIESFLPPAKESMTSSTGEKNGELGWVVNDYATALKQAKEQQKPVFIDFTGYTCTNCRWMEVNMFPKPLVRAELGKFIRVRLYTDGEGEPYEGFQKMQESRFGTVAMPLYAIVTPNDEIIARFEGLTRNEEEFANFLKSGLGK